MILLEAGSDTRPLPSLRFVLTQESIHHGGRTKKRVTRLGEQDHAVQSRNSVVHVVLTVSMTFVITVLGYVGTKEAAKRVQAAIPGSILVFVLSLLIALLYGTFIRESWYQL